MCNRRHQYADEGPEQLRFLLQDQIIPRLKSAIPIAVSFISSEDAQELVQDGTLIAAQMIHNAEQAGKKVVRNPGAARHGARKLSAVRTISAGNIAYYTIQKLKCGRRSTGSSTVDVYGSGTQINGATRLTSLDEAAPVASKIQDFMGSDILIQIRRKPNWKDSLDATREKMACREERKHGLH